MNSLWAFQPCLLFQSSFPSPFSALNPVCVYLSFSPFPSFSGNPLFLITHSLTSHSLHWTTEKKKKKEERDSGTRAANLPISLHVLSLLFLFLYFLLKTHHWAQYLIRLQKKKRKERGTHIRVRIAPCTHKYRFPFLLMPFRWPFFPSFIPYFYRLSWTNTNRNRSSSHSTHKVAMAISVASYVFLSFSSSRCNLAVEASRCTTRSPQLTSTTFLISAILYICSALSALQCVAVCSLTLRFRLVSFPKKGKGRESFWQTRQTDRHWFKWSW